MIRSFDADAVNALVNHPTIRPGVGGVGDLDLTQAVETLSNWFLLGEYGGFACCWSGPGIYEVHTFILPEGRGRWAIDAVSDAVAIMTAEGAELLWTRVDPAAAHTKRFCKLTGFERAGVNPLDLGSGLVEYEIYRRRLTCQ